jgi:predicted Zn-dependent protease
MRRLRLALLILTPLLLGIFPVVGCGSGHKNEFPLPPSFSTITPNYGGDINSVDYFTDTTITYRFVDPTQATDIHLNSIPAVAVTTAQANIMRASIGKWQAALALNAAPYQRTFSEVAPTDTTADIDIVMQTSDEFNSSAFTEQFGFTELYFRDVENELMGRAVIHLRNDLSTENFQYVTLHEFGHALGLNGHARRLATVMYPFQISLLPITDLTIYDINTIRATYTR